MPDICLIYARPSKPMVRQLQGLLSERYDVWWDEKIHSGDYRAEIEEALSHSKCVIPVWSRVSRADADVIDEANFALKRKIPLLPVMIEGIDPPLGFGSLHTVDLVGWEGEREHSGVQELLRNLGHAMGPRMRMLRREPVLSYRDHHLPLPTFFHSVSSHETQVAPDAAVHALMLAGTDAVLVSAYDLLRRNDVPSSMLRDLEACRAAGACVLLDSGNYESNRKGDAEWCHSDLREALQSTPHDLAFCFDNVTPPSNTAESVRDIVAAVERDSDHGRFAVLPIVHAPLDGNTGLPRPEVLPEVITAVARELNPKLIAVPERELGDGVIERSRTIVRIRAALNDLGFYQPLHLLGTGNPISIALFTVAGADCFDGLEWCRTVVDHASARLHHFQQFDFFAWQSEFATSDIIREAIRSKDVGYAGKVIFHNIEFFRGWISDVREMALNDNIDRLLADKLPGGTKMLKELATALPEVLT